MKRVLLCSFLAMALALAAAAADVSGKWSGNFIPEGGGDSNSAYMVLKQSGSSVTGTAGSSDSQQFALQNGKVEGNKISFQVTTDGGVVYKCDMVVEGDHMKGDISAAREGQAMKGKIEMTRQK